MVNQWYCRVLNEEWGPLSFQELVALFRDRTLSEDDLVRPDYQAAWQRAETVVGLSYMAFRARRPPVDADEPKPVQSSTTGSDQLLDEECGLSALTLVEAVSKQHGVRNVQGAVGRLAASELEAHELTGAESTFPSEDRATPGNSSDKWAATVAAAVEHIDRRHNSASAITGSRFSRLWRVIAGTSHVVDEFGGWSHVSRMAFVSLATIITGNSVAWSLLAWSNHEQLRFPSRRPGMDLPIFPMIGRCSELEYWLLFGHVVLFSVLGALFIARRLSSNAE